MNEWTYFLFLESAEKVQEELRELRIQHYTLKEQYDTLKEKMKFFTRVRLLYDIGIRVCSKLLYLEAPLCFDYTKNV